jgi:hypothetical protein
VKQSTISKSIKFFLLLIGLLFPVYYLLLVLLLILYKNDLIEPINETFIFFFMFVVPIQMITYLICVVKNKSFDKEKKLLWGFLVLGTVGFAPLVYWYLHIRKSDMTEFIEPQKNDESLICTLTIITYVLGILALILSLASTIPAEFFAVFAGIPALVTGFYSIILYIAYIYHNKSINGELIKFKIKTLISVKILIYASYAVVLFCYVLPKTY